MNYDETKELREVLGDKGERIHQEHALDCRAWRTGRQNGPCSCGADALAINAREQFVRLLAMTEKAT